MRAILREILVVFVCAVAVIAMCLGTLAVPGAEAGWLSRSWTLMIGPLTPDFYDPGARFGIVESTLSAALVTTALVLTTVVLLLALALPVGIFSVTRPESRTWRLARRVLEGLSSFPVLLWCTAIVVIVARVFQQNPTGALAPAFVIIALLMGDRLLVELIQRVAIATSEILAQPYMRLVRAGGFGVLRHLLQSLAGPVAATVLGRAMFLISGAIVAERIFGMGGLGARIVESLTRDPRDTKVALAASIALIVLGLVFRAGHRTTLLLADGRRREYA